MGPRASGTGGFQKRSRKTPQKAVIDQLFASRRPRRAPSEFIFGPEGAQERLWADPGSANAPTWRARAVPEASEAQSEASPVQFVNVFHASLAKTNGFEKSDAPRHPEKCTPKCPSHKGISLQNPRLLTWPLEAIIRCLPVADRTHSHAPCKSQLSLPWFGAHRCSKNLLFVPRGCLRAKGDSLQKHAF